jgi:hypothetical protein
VVTEYKKFRIRKTSNCQICIFVYFNNTMGTKAKFFNFFSENKNLHIERKIMLCSLIRFSMCPEHVNPEKFIYVQKLRLTSRGPKTFPISWFQISHKGIWQSTDPRSSPEHKKNMEQTIKIANWLR